MKKLAVMLTLTLCAWGCSAVKAPGPSPVPCSRVVLEPPPPWTASAAWNPGETEMLLIDPGSRSLATYGRDGSRRREILLDDVAEIDFSVPIRLERSADGYRLIDKTQVLTFDDNLSLRRRARPFAGLEEQGYLDGSFNDVLDLGGELVGYADFVDKNLQPANDPKAEGTWRRGFIRLDPAAERIDFLHELALDGDDEYAAYYLYDRRPYVSELDGKVYVLRFTDPWTVHRVKRGALRQVASGAGADGEARALHAWNGRLYVLTGEIVPEDGEEGASSSEPVPLQTAAGARVQAELLQALPAAASGRRRWILHEIDPSSAEQRRIELPTSAERLRLVPGRTFWTAVEETTVPNLGQERGTTFLFLPATEIVDGVFGCR